jgi:alpha-beta hydrolase superfamily lysophospholipase
MKLEVISYKPASPVHSIPILFVHGAWHGASSWEEHFLPYFHEQGFEVHALSWRGHGQSGGHEGIRWHSISDYISDVAEVAGRFSSPPIVVGHSFGGLVVQKYLEQNSAPAAVIMASIPTSGIIGFFLRYLVKHPIQFIKCVFSFSPYKLIETPELVRDVLFCTSTPETVIQSCSKQLQEESFRAALEGIYKLPRTKLIKTPILVLAAEEDSVVSINEAKRTAKAYQSKIEIFPTMGHDMMLENEWQSVANCIIAWLGDRKM